MTFYLEFSELYAGAFTTMDEERSTHGTRFQVVFNGIAKGMHLFVTSTDVEFAGNKLQQAHDPQAELVAGSKVLPPVLVPVSAIGGTAQVQWEWH